MERLLTPGPVAVPRFIMEAISQPVIPHRTPAFETFYQQLLQDLAYIFQTQRHTLTYNGSGTATMEAAIASLFSKEELVLVLNNGKFSQRWFDFANLLGLKTVEIKKPWGETVYPSEVIATIDQHPGLTGVIATHCETSTAALLDIEEIAFAIKAKNPDILVLVDAITTVGCLPFYFDQWGLDCAICASQKGFMNPTGIGLIALSDLAARRLNPSHASDYRNLYNYLTFAQKNSFPYSPPTQLLYGIQAAAKYIIKRSLPAIWQQTIGSWNTFQRGLEQLGGKNVSNAASPSLSAFYFPEKDNERIRKQLEEDQGIILSGGQGHLKGKIMRISHMGTSDAAAMEATLTALKPLVEK